MLTSAAWVPAASAKRSQNFYLQNLNGNSDPTNFERINVTQIRGPSIGYGGVISIGQGVRYHSDITRPSKTAVEQETDDRRDDCGEVKGNPVVLYTGNKVEIERQPQPIQRL